MTTKRFVVTIVNNCESVCYDRVTTVTVSIQACIVKQASSVKTAGGIKIPARVLEQTRTVFTKDDFA